MFLNAYPPGLCKQDTDAGEMDESKEAGGELVIANGDSAELLELEEELFHEMAFLVKPPIDEPRISLIVLGRDAKVRIMIGDKLTQCPFPISFVRKDGRALQPNSTEQFFSDRNVMDVAGRQHYLNWVAKSVYNSVNLGASAAPAHSDALIRLGLVHRNPWGLAGIFYGIGGL